MATCVSALTPLAASPSYTTVHTVDHHHWLTIRRIIVTNTTAAPLAVTVCFVPDGGTPSASNAVLAGYSVAANDFLEFGEGQILPPNSSIRACAGSGASVNLCVSGIEEVP